MNNLKVFLVSFVFGTAVTLALPIAAVYALLKYIDTAYRWNKKLVNKFRKHGHIS